MLKQNELRELLSVVERFKVRCDLWARDKVSDYKDKEPASVNYHWGAHYGMVDRSKEVVEMYKALTPLLEHYQDLEEELESAINCIEESGVDWEEVRSCY